MLPLKEIAENDFCIFTDGSALSNAKNACAGSCIYIPKINFIVLKSMYGTNNIAELEAIRYASRYVFKNIERLSKFIKNKTIHIISDSEYSIKAILGINQVKANKELIEKAQYYIQEINKKGFVVNISKVRAHTTNKDFFSVCNKVVDMGAKLEAKTLKETEEETIWHKVSKEDIEKLFKEKKLK